MERDNEKRQGSVIEPSGALSVEKQPPAELSFTVPTTFVDLPSEGKYYPADHPLHNKEQVEIRYMTAKEEDILTNQDLIKNGKAIDRVIQSLLIDRAIDVNSLLVGDKNAITVAARITGYGASYKVKVRCTDCGEVSEFPFDLREGRNVHTPTSEMPDGVTMTSQGTIRFERGCVEGLLHSVEMRMMRSKDEQKLADSTKHRKKKDLPPALVTDLLKILIVKVEDSDLPKHIDGFVDTLPPFVAKGMRTLYRSVTPDHSLAQEFKCSSCGFEDDMEVPFTVEFFWPK